MANVIRFGIAAAAALALAPPATPCDPRSYDPKDDSPHEQVCPPEREPSERLAQVEAEKARRAPQLDDARSSGSGSGSGSGAYDPPPRRRSALPADDYPHDDAPR
jgi:hypothetical protein